MDIIADISKDFKCYAVLCSTFLVFLKLGKDSRSIPPALVSGRSSVRGTLAATKRQGCNSPV